MEKEIEAIRMFRIFGVRGFILFPAIDENYNEEILRLTLERYPLVMVDRYLPKITRRCLSAISTAQKIRGIFLHRKKFL